MRGTEGAFYFWVKPSILIYICIHVYVYVHTSTHSQKLILVIHSIYFIYTNVYGIDTLVGNICLFHICILIGLSLLAKIG